MKFSGKFASVAVFAAFGVAAMAVADIGPFSSIGRMARTASSLSQSVVGVAEPTVTLQIVQPGVMDAVPSRNTNGIRRIRQTKFDAVVSVSQLNQGTVTFSVGGKTIGTQDLLTASGVRHPVDLSSIENLSPARLKAVVDYHQPGRPDGASKEIEVQVDTEGPLLSSVRLAGSPSADSVELILGFRADDLDSTTANNKLNFIVERAGAGDVYTALPNVASGTTGVTNSSVDGAFVTLTIKGPLSVGKHRVRLEKTLLDDLGNPAGQINSKEDKLQQFEFTPAVYGPSGPAIHFPQYTQREPLDPNTNFNPGDHVETRVVRLYYNRDAHRVAQIINRDIRQLNKAGFDNARRVANQARTEADVARTRREGEERDAIAVAEELRSLERQVAVAQRAATIANQELAQARAVQQQIDDLDSNSTQSSPSTSPVPFVNISGASIIAATIINPGIANGTITGGTQSPGNMTRTDGTLVRGSLSAGGLTAGTITWTTPDETQRCGTIIGGDIDVPNAPAVAIPITGGTIAGTTTGSSQTPLSMTGTLTTTGTLTGSVIRNASIQNALVQSLVVKTASPNQSQLDGLNLQLARMTGNKTGDMTTLTDAVTTTQKAVADIESKITQQKQAINQAKDKVAAADRNEQLANRSQFEAEVAAGTSDPDSYAPADLNSIDPVMQVSISVIGEGVIQLRGPLRGINEIRTMINQIDSPLGQVKVGLFTVQINGEEGDKMDEVAARLEGYIDLSRFLTNHSLQLLRWAVQEEAAVAISDVANQYPTQHRQIDRDRLYVYSFFGRDFIDELYEMDSEFLRTENKLLSIHAMDTVSLSQATFLIALAKNEIRQKILARFLYLVQTELPVAEYDQRRTAGMLKRSRDINAFRRLIAIPGFPKDPERALAKYRSQDMQKYCRKAHETYKFQNFINLMTADIPPGHVDGVDIMTPIQREFIRLAQIFKSQMIAEIELKQRVIERALIQDSAGDEVQMQREAREQHEDAIAVVKKAEQKWQEEVVLIRSEVQSQLVRKLDQISEANQRFNDGLKSGRIDELVEIYGPDNVGDRIPPGTGRRFTVIPPGSAMPLTFTAYHGAARASGDQEPPTSKTQLKFNEKLSESEFSERIKSLEDKGVDGIKRVDSSLWKYGWTITCDDQDRLNSFLSTLVKNADAGRKRFDDFNMSVENTETIRREADYLDRLKEYLPLASSDELVS